MADPQRRIELEQGGELGHWTRLYADESCGLPFPGVPPQSVEQILEAFGSAASVFSPFKYSTTDSQIAASRSSFVLRVRPLRGLLAVRLAHQGLAGDVGKQ